MIMRIWHYVHKERYLFEFRNKVRSECIGELAMDRDIRRVSGVGLLYYKLVRGVMYMLGEAEVVAQPNSSFLNKIVVNYAYTFLRKNFRQGNQLMAVPRKRLLMIGMTYGITHYQGSFHFSLTLALLHFYMH
ncbi:hypothetical protein HN51_065543 [Arachis hypogaea]